MTQTTQFQKLYERERHKIEEKLKKIAIGEQPASLYEPATYSLVLAGKRLRPFLVLLSAHAAGLAYSEVYNAALAVEMLHTFTLVHDDIMDNANIRRGHPTLHKKYDISTAILAGDVLLAVAYNYLLKDAKRNTVAVTRQFTNGLIEVCEGQALDKEFESRKTVTIDEYLVMITKKTAVLIETCCAIGALLAGADKKVLNGLKQYGRGLGIAFQIQDDLLDVIGNEKDFGKKIGGDLMEGKKTYPFLVALQNAKGRDLAALKRMIAQKGISEKEIPEYTAIYERTGALEASRKAIDSYTKKAKGSLKIIASEKERDVFLWLSDLLIKRTY